MAESKTAAHLKQINPAIFKAYDIRGVYPDEFDEDIAYRTARAFAQKLRPGLTILGHDMRVSSPALVEPVAHGLMDGGSDVIEIGLTTTPMFYYAVNALGGDAGVTVTASHNPEQYNGLKMTGPKAIPSIDYVTNDELYRLANSGKFETPARQGKLRDPVNPIEGYVKAVKKVSGLEDFGGLKLVVDSGNGMEGIVLPTLFKEENVDVTPLYWQPDGRFPHHEANPLKEQTLTDLKQKVIELKANLGIAYDGDGDRVGFMDETGMHIPCDIMTAIIAREMLKYKPGATIIYDLRSSHAVPEEIEKAGGKPVIWKVGHGLVKKKMREIGAWFAGELSCHYYFSDFYVTDNGDLAMLEVIRTILMEGKPLSEIARPIIRYYHSQEINSQVEDRQETIKMIGDRYRDGRRSDLDGLTVEYDSWWFNVRASQTEPLLRLNVEATTRQEMEDRINELVMLIRGTPPTAQELIPLGRT